MNFLHPAIAWAGLASVALPIVIHLLFRRRRVSVEWAAMELLREAVRRTNRRLKFEQWLVLALRCLTLLAAGLAIAVPVLDASTIGGEIRRLVVVVVDNGPASGLRGGAESELARVLDEVRAQLAERGARDRVAVVLASTPVALALAPTADAAAIEQALARIETSQTPSELKDALALANATIGAEKASGEIPRIVVASAFRQSSVRPGVELAAARAEDASASSDAPSEASGGTPGAPRTEVIALVPAQDVPTDARVSRVEARPSPTGEAVLVRAVIAREGASLEAGQTFVRVAAAGMSTPAARAVMWEKGQSEATVDFQLVPAGLAEGTRRIGVAVTIEDDALAAGNAGFAAVDVRRDLEIGVIGRRTALDATDLERVPASLWVARALSPAVGSGMRVREIDPSSCDARALLGLDAVVLARPDLVAPAGCEALGRFALDGGVVIVLPAGESLAQSWGQAVFARLSVPVRIAAEAVDREPALRLAEEQQPSALLGAIGPEIAALVAPIESRRVAALSGFAKGEIVLANADGTPFIVAQAPRRDDGRAERGMVIAFAAAPELLWTNLPVKPLMVPLFQELARAGIQIAAGRNEVAVGEALVGEASAVMRGDGGATITLDEEGRSREVVRTAGVWRSDAGAVVAANLRPSSLVLAPNAEDVVRSALAPIGEVRFRAAASDGGAPASAARASSDWSFGLLVAALALLLVEGVLSRAFSHASVRRSAPVGAAVAIVGRVQTRGAAPTPAATASTGAVSGGRA
jgi:hypothetical protein